MHRYVGDAVLDEFVTGDLEAEASVPVDEVCLSIEDDRSGGRRRDVADECRSEATPTIRRVRRDPSDSHDATRFGEHAEVGGDVASVTEPHVSRPGLHVAAVEIGVRTSLFDDEHVAAQSEQRMEFRRGEFVEGLHGR